MAFLTLSHAQLLWVKINLSGLFVFRVALNFLAAETGNRIMPRTNYHVSITPHPGCAASPPPYRDYYPVTLCNRAQLNLSIPPRGGEGARRLIEQGRRGIFG